MKLHALRANHDEQDIREECQRSVSSEIVFEPVTIELYDCLECALAVVWSVAD